MAMTFKDRKDSAIEPTTIISIWQERINSVLVGLLMVLIFWLSVHAAVLSLH